MTEQDKYITPHELVITTISLLRLSGGVPNFLKNAIDWGVNDYAYQAQELGAKVLYEPLRPKILGSQTRQRKVLTNGGIIPSLEHIKYLAEPARSEHKLSDYQLDHRLLFQLFYSVIEESRFNPVVIEHLLQTQGAIKRATDEDIPVRVYPDRNVDGLPSAFMSETLKKKIYSPDQVKLFARALKASQHIVSKNIRAQSVAWNVDMAMSFSMGHVDGMELNLLSLVQAIGDDHELLSSVTFELLKLVKQSSNSPERPLIQTITIQPNRSDLAKKMSLESMIPALQVAQSLEFKGTIIYAPETGDVKNEVKKIKEYLF